MKSNETLKPYYDRAPVTCREHNGKYIFQKDGVYFGLTKEQLIDFNSISADILGQSEQFKNLRNLAFIISTDETQPEYRRIWAKELYDATAA